MARVGKGRERRRLKGVNTLFRVAGSESRRGQSAYRSAQEVLHKAVGCQHQYVISLKTAIPVTADLFMVRTTGS